MEGWVLDDPVALGLPDKDFFADRLKMEAERFTTGTRGAIDVFSNSIHSLAHCIECNAESRQSTPCADDAARAFRTFVKDTHNKNERDTLVVASVAELVLFQVRRTAANQRKSHSARRCSTRMENTERW